MLSAILVGSRIPLIYFQSEEAELESCTVAERNVHQSLERTASQSNDGNEEYENNGDDEDELLDLEVRTTENPSTAHILTAPPE